MADEDELLNPDDIEELLNSDSSRTATGEGTAGEPAAGGDSTIAEDNADGMLNASMLESAGQQGQSSDSGIGDSGETRRSAETEALLQQAEADLATALAPEREAGQPDLSGITPFQLESFDSQPGSKAAPADLAALQDVELDLRIELGRTELLLDDVMRLAEGSVVPLDKLAGDPVDILVNGKLIGRGEVLVLNDNFCVRVVEIVAPEI